MGLEEKESFLLKIGKSVEWDRDANRLNQVGEKGAFIVGASTDGARAVLEATPANIIYVNFTTGNDTTGTGTALNPYKTYAKAVSVWSAGKTIEWMTSDDLTDLDIEKPLQAAIGQNPIWGGAGWIDKSPATDPGDRAAHKIAYLGTYIYQFGGYDTGGTVSAKTWRYDIGTNLWNDQAPAASPSARANFGMVKHGSYLYLYGGETLPGRSSETYRYDPGANTWASMAPATNPGERSDFDLVSDGTYIYLFGGKIASQSYNNDIWRYDPAGNTWLELTPSGTIPDGRNSHFTGIISDKIYIFGGLKSTGNYNNDIHEYDITGNSYNELTPAVNPTARHSASGASKTGQFIIFGGWAAGNTILNDFWVFDGSNWIESTYSSLPTARYWSAAAYENENLYIHAGKNLSVFYDDTWTLTEQVEISDASALCGFTINEGSTVLIGDLNNPTTDMILNCSGNSILFKATDRFHIIKSKFINGSIIPASSYSADLIRFQYSQLENFNIDFDTIGSLQFWNNYLQSTEKTALKISTIGTLQITDNLIKCDNPDFYAMDIGGTDPDLSCNNNDILGNVNLGFSIASNIPEYRDNITELLTVFNSLNTFEIESGNIRGGFITGATAAAIVSNINPLFKNPNNDFDLRRKSEGFASDSQLIAKSEFSTYFYDAQNWPRDLGCYDMNNQTAVTKWARSSPFPLPKNKNLFYDINNKFNFATSVNNTPQMLNFPNDRLEVLTMRFTTIPDQYMAIIEQLETYTDQTVFISLYTGLEAPITFETDGIQSAGAFVLNIDAADIPIGSRFTWNQIDYWVINRDPDSASSTRLVLNRKLVDLIPNAQVIQTFDRIGLGEYLNLQKDKKTLIENWTKAKGGGQSGLELTFVRKKP